MINTQISRGKIGYSNKFRRDLFYMFIQINNYAYMKEYLNEPHGFDAMKLITLKFKRQKNTEPYSMSDLNSLYNATETAEQKCIIYIYIITSLMGGRVSEMLGLELDDYLEGHLSINSAYVCNEMKSVKTDLSNRVLKLTESAIININQYLEISKPFRELLPKEEKNRMFFNPIKNKVWNSDDLYKESVQIFKKFGFEDKFRGLKPTRHTFATECKKNGVSSEEIWNYLGHSDCRMLDKSYVGWKGVSRSIDTFPESNRQRLH